MIRIGYTLLPLCFLSLGYINKGHHITLVLLALCFIARLINVLSVRYFFYYAAAWCFVLRAGVFFGVPGYKGDYAFIGILSITTAAIVYLAITKTKTPNYKFYNAICIAALFQTSLGTMQMFVFDPVLWAYNLFVPTVQLIRYKIPVGTLGNPNFVAGYLAISIPFFFRAKWKWFLFPIILFMFLLQSTSGFLAVVAAFVVFFWNDTWHKWPVVTFSILGAFVYAFWIDSGEIFKNERIGFWQSTLKTIFSGPVSIIFGFGPKALTGYKFPLHNEWLQMFHQYGLIGISLAVTYFVEVYATLKTNRILFAALVAACANCLGNYPVHLAPSLFLILIILGLIERERHGRLSNLC